MKTTLIVGAGQLGSRHLQGLLKSEYDNYKVHVLDTSVDSLSVAKSRAEEVQHGHSVEYHLNWDQIPAEVDFAIIATNSDVRESVANSLLEKCRVRYLVMEKVLFQDIDSYSRVSDLISRTNTSVWVNHPMRMYDHYIKLKTVIADTGNLYSYSVVGSNWGLGCNSLHFIDLFCFLSDASLVEIDAGWIHSELIKSKRPGFFEFTGVVNGLLSNGMSFSIHSFPGQPGPRTVYMSNQIERIVIQESGTPQLLRLSASNSFSLQSSPILPHYQSSLTTKLVEELFDSGTCNLPTYQVASIEHEVFIKALLSKYNEITGKTSKLCPIT